MRDPIFYKILDKEDKKYYQIKPTYDAKEFPRWVVEEAAMDFFKNHDGSAPLNWPLQISLHKAPNCKEICRFLVDFECEPVFYARENKIKE